MESLREMRVLIAVVDQGSFARAATALAMSRPAVSRAIASLEASLGVQLLVRTTRVLTVTPVGQRYVDDCRRIVELAAASREAARGEYGAIQGHIAFTAPTMFGRLHVMPAAAAFLNLHDGVTLQASLHDRLRHLEEEGFDLAVRIGPLADSAHRARKVGEVRAMIVAAPAYLDAHGSPKNPDALGTHRVIARSAAPRWRFSDHARALRPAVALDDMQATIELALRGFGLAQVLSYQVGHAIQRGTLVEVLHTHAPPAVPVHILFAQRAREPARVRAFAAHLTTHLRAAAARDWVHAPDEDPRAAP